MTNEGQIQSKMYESEVSFQPYVFPILVDETNNHGAMSRFNNGQWFEKREFNVNAVGAEMEMVYPLSKKAYL